MEDGDDIHGIDDLFEFYRQWPELRAVMVDLAGSDRLASSERKILTSMIATMDRVGPSDLDRDAGI